MRRREFIAAVAASALPLGARAQQSSPIRIGMLMGFNESDALVQSYVAAMRQKLAELGWLENRNIQFVHRWAGGDPEKKRIADLTGCAGNRNLKGGLAHGLS